MTTQRRKEIRGSDSQFRRRSIVDRDDSTVEFFTDCREFDREEFFDALRCRHYRAPAAEVVVEFCSS
ncbi:hypothetical protein [Rhodococcus koreensis]